MTRKSSDGRNDPFRHPYPLAEWRGTSRCPQTGMVTLSLDVGTTVIRYRIADHSRGAMADSLRNLIEDRGREIAAGEIATPHFDKFMAGMLDQLRLAVSPGSPLRRSDHGLWQRVLAISWPSSPGALPEGVERRIGHLERFQRSLLLLTNALLVKIGFKQRQDRFDLIEDLGGVPGAGQKPHEDQFNDKKSPR